jgi:serine/threonine-protein kinase
VIGRYAIHEEIASGGMATVYLGSLVGTGGFSRSVAIKRLHPHLARDPEFVRMFLDEARVAARIQHPNVVPVLDVVNAEGEIFLVMEYVDGDPLARLAHAARERRVRIPVAVAAAIVVGVLRGLHAAHEATDEQGHPLCIVHRDVSPQNVLVARDGVAHLLDFGVAKAAGQLQPSRSGRIKGKVSYMPPEQARGAEITRAVDIYAAGVIFWELLAGDRLFAGENEAVILERVLFGEVVAPSCREGPAELDEIVMRAIARDPAARFSTARDMARAIEAAVSVSSTSEVSEWLEAQGPVPPTASQLGLEGQVSGSYGMTAGSGIRTSVEPGPRARRTLRSRAMLPVALALLSTGALLAVLRIDKSHARATAAALAPASLQQPSAAETTVHGPSEPAPSEVAANSAQPSSPPASSNPTRPTLRRPPTAPRIGRDACNPPFTVGPDGVKQYKVQCL